jgi:lysozyme family protein
MRYNFALSLIPVLKHEGGYVNHPKDPGGATNKGITLQTLSEYLGRPASKYELVRIDDETVETIYRKQYWDACRCSELPSGVDLVVFDAAVNSGPSRSVKWLQEVIGVKEDGLMGPVTLEAVGKCLPEVLIDLLINTRFDFLKGLGIWDTFGKGWTRRIDDVKKVAFTLIEYDCKEESELVGSGTQLSEFIQSLTKVLEVHGDGTVALWDRDELDTHLCIDRESVSFEKKHGVKFTIY